MKLSTINSERRQVTVAVNKTPDFITKSNKFGGLTMSDMNLPSEVSETTTESAELWGDQAPRGGRTVLARVLKDGVKVPMFLGQTLIKSLRDQGYNSTTSALCE